MWISGVGQGGKNWEQCRGPQELGLVRARHSIRPSVVGQVAEELVR